VSFEWGGQLSGKDDNRLIYWTSSHWWPRKGGIPYWWLGEWQTTSERKKEFRVAKLYVVARVGKVAWSRSSRNSKNNVMAVLTVWY